MSDTQEPKVLQAQALDAVIAKITRCFAYAESDNEHEAQVAMAQAQRLMAKHGVTQAQVNAAIDSDYHCDERVIGDRMPLEGAFIGRLLNTYFQVRIMQSGILDAERKRRMTIIFVGRPVNVAIAQHTFGYLLTQFRESWGRYAKAMDYGPDMIEERTGFVDGLTTGIEETIKRERRAMQQEGLVLVEDPGVQTAADKWMTQAQDQAIPGSDEDMNDFLEGGGIDPDPKSVRVQMAMRAGRDEGRKMQLNPAIANQGAAGVGDGVTQHPTAKPRIRAVCSWCWQGCTLPPEGADDDTYSCPWCALLLVRGALIAYGGKPNAFADVRPVLMAPKHPPIPPKPKGTGIGSIFDLSADDLARYGPREPRGDRWNVEGVSDFGGEMVGPDQRRSPAPSTPEDPNAPPRCKKCGCAAVASQTCAVCGHDKDRPADYPQQPGNPFDRLAGESASSVPFVRVSGEQVCVQCGREYRRHVRDTLNLDREGNPYLRLGCDGRRLKL